MDALVPETMVYAPGPNGQLQLAAVEYLVPVLRAGARGYVMKGAILKVAEAIRLVCSDEIYASASVGAQLDGQA